MDIQEKLIESHKTISKISTTLLTLILVLSVYVIQRSLAVLGFSQDLFIFLLGEAKQIHFFNLGFSYKTMTVIWPGILGGLCIIFTLLDDKRKRIEYTLRRSNDDIQKINILDLDPFHFSAIIFRSKSTRRIGHLFALFPMIAILTHLIMLYLWIAIIGFDAIRLTNYKMYLPPGYEVVAAGAVFSTSSIVFAIIGFFGSLSFLKSLKKRIKKQNQIIDDSEKTDQDVAFEQDAKKQSEDDLEPN